VRRLALYNTAGFAADHAVAAEIWELACTTWGPSSLRDLRILIWGASAQCLHELCIAAAQCPRLEALRIPRIFLPQSFVAAMVEGPSTTCSDAATPAAGLSAPCLPLPTARRFDFAPYAATLRSLELSDGPANATEFCFIATQLPSLRCLILKTEGGGARSIPSAVWRRGMRQLLRQLHKLYIWSLSRRLCRALNTLHAFAAADAQRSTALGLPPGAMAAILQPDPDAADDIDDDDASDNSHDEFDADVAPFSSTPIDADSPINADATPRRTSRCKSFRATGTLFLANLPSRRLCGTWGGMLHV
jgi:hypothetical protein